jgi:hypothetical protein
MIQHHHQSSGSSGGFQLGLVRYGRRVRRPHTKTADPLEEHERTMMF